MSKLHDITNYSVAKELTESGLLHKDIDKLKEFYESADKCNYCIFQPVCFDEGEPLCTDFNHPQVKKDVPAIKTLIKSGWLAEYKQSIEEMTIKGIMEDDLK